MGFTEYYACYELLYTIEGTGIHSIITVIVKKEAKIL